MTRVLVIGAAGVEWRSLQAALQRGLVPVIAGLAQRSVMTPLRCTQPQHGPSPWTSLVTGHDVENHGVFRPDEVWPGGLRSIGKASWQTPPIWETLALAGVTCASVGWPATRRSTGWAGLHIDDSFAVATGLGWHDWALPLDCVPRSCRAALRNLRVHPAEIDGAQLLPLVPGLAGIDQQHDTGLVRLATAMAEAATTHAAATFILAEQRPELMLVHYHWLAEIIAAFSEAPAPYADVVDGSWRFLDVIIGRLLTLVGSDCLVLLASSGAPGSAGVLIGAGPHVVPDRARFATTMLDIAPTLLACFGLRDPGLKGTAIETLTSSDQCRESAASAVRPVSLGRSELDRVVALGYRPPPQVAAHWHVAGLVALGRAVLPRAPATAGALADTALAILPDDIGALRLLAASSTAVAVSSTLPAIADKLARLAPDLPWASVVHGAYHALRGEAALAQPHLEAAERSGDVEALLRVGAAWLFLNRPVPAERAFTAVLAVTPDHAEAAIGLSIAALARGRLHQAEAPLRRALASDPANVDTLSQLARVLRAGGRSIEADAADQLIGVTHADVA